jgi:hypothetical protein
MGQPLKRLFQNDLQKCPVEKSIIAIRCHRAVLGFFGLDGLRSAIGCILSDWKYPMRIYQ